MLFSLFTYKSTEMENLTSHICWELVKGRVILLYGGSLWTTFVIWIVKLVRNLHFLTRTIIETVSGIDQKCFCIFMIVVENQPVSSPMPYSIIKEIYLGCLDQDSVFVSLKKKDSVFVSLTISSSPLLRWLKLFLQDDSFYLLMRCYSATTSLVEWLIQFTNFGRHVGQKVCITRVPNNGCECCRRENKYPQFCREGCLYSTWSCSS